MRALADTGVRSSCWPAEPQEHNPDGRSRPGRAELVDVGVRFETADEIGLPRELWRRIRTTSTPCASVRLFPAPPSRPSSLLVLRSPTTRGSPRPCAAGAPTGSLMSACTVPHRGSEGRHRPDIIGFHSRHPRLGLTLTGWPGLGKHRGRSWAAAGRPYRPRGDVSFWRVLAASVPGCGVSTAPTGTNPTSSTASTSSPP